MGWVWDVLPCYGSRSHLLQSILGRDSPPQTAGTWQGMGSPCSASHHHTGLGDLLGLLAAPSQIWLVPGLGQVWLQDIMLVPICWGAFSCTVQGGAWQRPAGTLHEVGRRLGVQIGGEDGESRGKGDR